MSCDEAWNEGTTVTPQWWRTAKGLLDPAGVHALLRQAHLPEPELRYMGWRTGDLRPDRTRGFRDTDIAERLGRIKLDEQEVIWTGDPLQRDLAIELGWKVIRKCFIA